MDITIDESYLEHRFQNIRQLADRGHTKAQYIAADCLCYGKGTKKDPAAALRYMTEAANKGYPEAELALGSWYCVGVCTDVDIPTALKWYERAADHGMGKAYACVGKLYQIGGIPGIPKAPGYAMELYEMAAKNGWPDALVTCGLMRLEKGDCEAALDCFSRGREKGVARAALLLGDMYLLGVIHAPRHEDALACYKQAANLGSTISALLVWECARRGIGCRRDADFAAYWEARCSQLGLLDGRTLGQYLFLHYRDMPLPSISTLMIAQWLKEETAFPHIRPDSYRMLGDCYANGYGMVQDDDAAAEMYERGADAGDPISCRRLADCYAEGRGVPQDRREAALLRDQAEQLERPED